MDVFLILVFVLPLILDTVCGVYLCSSGRTSWSDGISQCLTGNGSPLSFKEVTGTGFVPAYRIWTADFFDTSFSESNELCPFVYKDRSGITTSSNDLLCGCAEFRNYLCRDDFLADRVVILNGNWTDAIKCGTFSQSDVLNIEWKKGYYWIGDRNYTGKLGQVTNWETLPTNHSKLYCGTYKNGVVSYTRDCGRQRISLCHFDTLPNNYINNSCNNLATTTTTTKTSTNSVKISQTIIRMTSSFGNPVSRHRETSQTAEGSSPSGTTAVANAHKDNPKETKHTDITTAAGAGVGLSLALIGALVALILIQRRYGCIRCLKTLKDKPITGDKSFHANPAYDVTDDFHNAHFNSKTKATSLERSKYENLMLTKTKEPQYMLSCAQNTDYSFALDANGPDKTERKVEEHSYKENKQSTKTGVKTWEYSFASDVDGANKTESKVEEDSYKENEYDTTQHVRKAPPTDQNVYNRTYASNLEENVYSKTNGVWICENVYNKTDTADAGQNVYDKTFDRNVQKVPVTNEYGSPMTKVDEEFDSTFAAKMLNGHAENIYNLCN